MQLIIKRFRDLFVSRADQPAIIDGIVGARYTYKELEDLSSRTASHLFRNENARDRVLLLLPNCMEMIVSYLACMQAGVISVPVNPDFGGEEIRTLIEIAAPSLIVTDRHHAPKLPAGISAPVMCWNKDISLTAIQQTARLDDAMFPFMTDEHLAHIVFSSGTTGMPKAIPIRFGRIIGQAAMFVESHHLNSECRFYNVLPLAYLGGWYDLTLIPLMSGGTIVLDKAFGAAGIYRFWDTALKHGVNCVWFTPSMLSALLAVGTEDETQAETIRRQIRWGMVGMAPLMPDLKRRFEKAFGFRLQQSYGLSETLLFTSWMSDITLPDASVGKCLEGYEMKITDSGEIRVRGQWIFDGYWNQPELSDSVFDEEGYFKTGDIGHLDESGNLYLTGRIKDLIIRGGVNISPAEIEAVLHRMECIKDAAVIGMPDALYGEKIIACVTVNSPHMAAADNIMEYCRKHLSAFKTPSAVHVLKDMPLNASGKIQKNALKEMLGHGTAN